MQTARDKPSPHCATLTSPCARANEGRVPMRIRCSAAMAVAVGLFPCLTLASVPSALSLQGRLLTLGGVPYSGDAPIELTLWDAPADGNALWAENEGVIPLTDGVLWVTAGAKKPIASSLFDGSPLYLELKVGGFALDRQPLASVPFA